MSRLQRRRASYWRILRTMRRVMQHAGLPPRDERGERRPATYPGIIGRTRAIMAHRRQRKGRAPLPRSLRRWRR